VTKTQFGVSETEDGDKVITPLGPFGKAYAYSDRLIRRFSTTMTLLLWVVAVACAIAVIGSFAKFLDSNQLVETILLIIVCGDALRVLFVFWIFRHGQPVLIGKLQGIPTMFSNTWQVRGTTCLWIFFEAVFLLGVIMDISRGVPLVKEHVLGVLFFHLTLYPLRHSYAAYNH